MPLENIKADSLPPLPETAPETEINSQQTPPPQFPPINMPQNETLPTNQSLPSVPADTTPQLSDSKLNLNQPSSRFRFLKRKIFIFLILVVLILIATGGGFYYFLNQKVTNYTLIPDDTSFYLGLSVKKHPQVQKLLTLSKKLPGGEKMVKFLDDKRGELFGTRKDPFAEILKLADSEIFLAKVSTDDPSARGSTLEKLINIVNFKNSNAASTGMATVEKLDNVRTTKEAYGSAKIVKFELRDAQGSADKSDKYTTGPLPYQVTLPLSKSIFAANVDNFIAAAEQESDLKRVLDLASGKDKDKLKSIATDGEHNEIVSHFPKEYLLKFYQKQVLDPFTNLAGPGIFSSFLGGGTYDTRTRNTKGDNVFTTKRGLTIVAQDNGIDLTTYQLTKKSAIAQGLAHGFTLDSSLANKLPAIIAGKKPLFFAEVRNVRDSIQDQINQFEDVAKNSSDDNQKKTFESSVKGIRDMKSEMGKGLGLDVDSDLLSWMDQNAAVMFNVGFEGKAPELLTIFDVKDPEGVGGKLSKIKIDNFVELTKQREKFYRDQTRLYNLSSLQRYLTDYQKKYGKYPASFEELLAVNKYIQYKDPLTKIEYGYTQTGGSEGFTLGTHRELASDLTLNEKSPPVDTTTQLFENNLPKVSPISTDYKDTKIYTLPIYDYKDQKIAFSYTIARNLVIFSLGTSDESLKDIIDYNGGNNTLAQDSMWKEQFAKAPKIVGSVFYVVPENLMGLYDYAMNFNPQYKDYVQNDYLTIVRGYLKSLRSVGTTTTQEGKTFISNTFVNIVELPAGESKQVEDALDRVLSGKSSLFSAPSSRIDSANDARMKSDIGQIATALQAYYTTPGQGKYPANLQTLVTGTDLKTLPKTPAGFDYVYITCNNFQESVIYGKLTSNANYWAWSTKTGKAQETAAMPNVDSCSKGVLGVKTSKVDSIKNFLWNNGILSQKGS
jgi:hypothetical protein